MEASQLSGARSNPKERRAKQTPDSRVETFRRLARAYQRINEFHIKYKSVNIAGKSLSTGFEGSPRSYAGDFGTT